MLKKRIEVWHHNDTQLNATKVLKRLHMSKKYSTFAIVLNKLAL